MGQQASSVESILDDLEKLADNEDTVTVDDVVDAIGGRGFGPLILLPALLVITPLGGIPGFPTLMAAVILMIAAQSLMQKKRIWLPNLLGDRGVKNEKVTKSTKKLRSMAKWIDEHMGQRLKALVSEPMQLVAAGIVAVLCLLVPPSELVPFAAILPMGAIAVLGLALSLRDGLVMLVGLVVSLVALYFVWTMAL